MEKVWCRNCPIRDLCRQSVTEEKCPIEKEENNNG